MQPATRLSGQSSSSSSSSHQQQASALTTDQLCGEFIAQCATPPPGSPSCSADGAGNGNGAGGGEGTLLAFLRTRDDMRWWMPPPGTRTDAPAGAATAHIDRQHGNTAMHTHLLTCLCLLAPDTNVTQLREHVCTHLEEYAESLERHLRKHAKRSVTLRGVLGVARGQVVYDEEEGAAAGGADLLQWLELFTIGLFAQHRGINVGIVRCDANGRTPSTRFVLLDGVPVDKSAPFACIGRFSWRGWGVLASNTDTDPGTEEGCLQAQPQQPPFTRCLFTWPSLPLPLLAVWSSMLAGAVSHRSRAAAASDATDADADATDADADADADATDADADADTAASDGEAELCASAETAAVAAAASAM